MIWPRHGEIAGVLQRPIEAAKQTLDRLGPGQRLAEGPDGVGIGNRITEPETEKPLEAQPVLDLELRLFV